jgi:transcriptional regulator with XRE-family HTH domain
MGYGHHFHQKDSRAETLLQIAKEEKGWSQAALAELIKVPAIQIKRYEAGRAQPPLDVIRNLAKVLQVSADELIFGEDERAPSDDLKLQFEAVSRFPEEEKRIVKALLEGMILKHQAKRWANI